VVGKGILMQTYLDRYLEGDNIGVWSELVALGPAVRDEPVFADAQSVAYEIMLRAKHNIDLLVERLEALEYRFVASDEVWTPPDADLIQAMDALEQRYGFFPIAIRKWFEVVGQGNFMGAHPKLSRYDGRDWGGSEQLGCYSDPMMVGWFSRLRGELLSFYINMADDWDEMAIMEQENPPPYGIDIGLSAINKANHSGSGSVQMVLPNPSFDAPLIDWDHYWMGTFFIPYLRVCFEWGGFPGLRALAETVRPTDELDFLTQGLLVI
jgi:hypothetical protein